MTTIRAQFKALVREDLTGKKIGLQSFPLPEEIPAHHVLVHMAFAPINPSDWMYFLRNSYAIPETLTPPPSVPGFEGCGTIIKTGEGVDPSILNAKVAFILDKSKLKFWGSWAEFCVVPKHGLIPFSDGTPLEDIHSVFINPATVFAMAEELTQNSCGTVLFNAGGSSLCRMAVRYFRTKGIRTILIVRREEQVRELLELGANRVLDSSSSDFSGKLEEALDSEKPSVFFDAVAGDEAIRVFELFPPNSILYNYGMLSGKSLSNLNPSELIFKNKSVRYVRFIWF